MLYECHHCHEYKGIQAFHNSQEEQVCKDCYEETLSEEEPLSEEDIKKAILLYMRKEIKTRLQELDKEEELPF